MSWAPHTELIYAQAVVGGACCNAGRVELVREGLLGHRGWWERGGTPHCVPRRADGRVAEFEYVSQIHTPLTAKGRTQRLGQTEM